MANSGAGKVQPGAGRYNGVIIPFGPINSGGHMPSSFRMSTIFAIVSLLTISSCTSAGPLPPPDPAKTAAANEALRISLERGEPDVYVVKRLLEDQNFTALDKLYRENLKLYKNDVSYESLVQKSFDLLKSENGFFLQKLDAWVSQAGSALAYAARGIFKAQEGFRVRGTKFVNEIPSQDIEEMHRWHIEAASDLQQALHLDSSLMPAYGWLIQIAKASSMPFSADEVFSKALTKDDRTYYVRSQYMSSLTPRWGGSYSAMAALIEEAAPKSDVNPRLWTLAGEIAADQGDNYWFQKDYPSAAKKYSQALDYGDRIAWLRHRAGCYYNMGFFDRAIEDWSRVLTYSPGDEVALRWLANARKALSQR
jgi:tetratricopeptide (TPR) repeat protein